MLDLKVATIVVTYNRLGLLKQSIYNHINQTRRTDLLLIVDNSSTDGTSDFLKDITLDYAEIKIIKLKENTGGAGGFYAGLDFIKQKHPEIDWVWLMDDDALPAYNALEALLDGTLNMEFIYGSLPNMNEKCSWPNINLNKKKLNNINDFEGLEEVNWIPFLGFFISMNLVNKIGLPEKDFFLAADDVEYSFRAKQYGSKIFINSDSKIEHPCAETYRIFILYRFLTNLKLVPWKRYYDTRNRILVARKYYGVKLYFQTIPASFLRLLATLLYEDNRLLQIKAFLTGIYDGLLNKKGKRHDYWNL
ncbi:glycosyltransferase [Acinetobacter faecalis]|uniref:Glycosyltransferase n=1 Tax=Acinetobacter faecalis TaxID=2665161 RepID=A0ABU5GGX0_9GAMM|nr:glycosyltransferase [Acinetobacter faecalis]MDY6549683.1 glycosyltransferase [Acinetobacter faecalis]